MMIDQVEDLMMLYAIVLHHAFHWYKPILNVKGSSLTVLMMMMQGHCSMSVREQE